MAEVSNTLGDPNTMRLEIPIIQSFNSLVWIPQKPDKAQCITQSINSPNRKFCDISLEHTVMASGMWYTATKLPNEFFSIPVRRAKQFACTWNRWQYVWGVWPQGYVGYPSLHYSRVWKDLDCPDTLKNIRLVHSFDDIMQNWWDEQEAASSLKALVRHMSCRMFPKDT